MKTLEELFSHFYTFYYNPMLVSEIIKQFVRAGPNGIKGDVVQEVIKSFKDNWALQTDNQDDDIKHDPGYMVKNEPKSAHFGPNSRFTVALDKLKQNYRSVRKIKAKLQDDFW